jgi:phosphate-selective porin
LFDRQLVNDVYDPAGTGKGAWELAARYSVFYADRKFFEQDGLYSGWEPLDPAKNVNAGYTWILGVNWYPDTLARFMFDWIRTYAAKDELAGGLSGVRSVKSIKSESTLLLRIQLEF